jgi:hypothetical protein
MPPKAARSVARQCEERARHARGQIGKDAEDRAMIPIDVGETSTNCSRRGPSFSCIGSLQLLQAVEVGVEHGSWHAHSLIAIERTEFVDVSIRLAANNC